MSQSLPISIVDAIAVSVNDDASIATVNDSVRASIGKVICVGRNYAEHARELGNEIPTSPMLFMKPVSSVVSIHHDIVRPDVEQLGETHYEAELCIQLSADLSKATIEQAKQAISGLTLGLDLTLRELQSKLKDKGHPWERAKCFDGACVLADWIDPQAFGDFKNVEYQFYINNELKQNGASALMLFPVHELLVDISHAFSLQAGDVIMTGTPSGVGILQAGDALTLKLGTYEWQSQVR